MEENKVEEVKENNKRKIFIIIGVIILAILIIIGIAFYVRYIINEENKTYSLEEISEEDYKYFTVQTDGSYGVINTEGELIVENNYTSIIIPNPTKAVFICTKEDGSIDILNENAEKIFTEYENVSAIEINGTTSDVPYEKSVLRYEENGKYGLIDFEGNIVTKAIYEEISSVKYKEGEILAKKDGQYGVINNKGYTLINFEYEEIEADKYYIYGSYSSSGYIVKKTTDEGYRYGYINSSWDLILDVEYTSISRISDILSQDAYLIISKDGQYGVCKNEEIKIDFAYQSIVYNADTNLYAVERSSKFGVLDINSKTIVEIQYKSIKFNGLYICASSYEGDTYFNKNGEVVENSYKAVTSVSNLNCYITINNENLYGLIDSDENILIENNYLYIEYVFDNYFVAYKEGQGLGLIDKENNVIVDFQYDVLSKIGDMNLLKGVDMENNVTDIYSGDLEKLTSVTNATIDIHDDYIEIYNENTVVFVSKKGEIKTAQEIYTENKLFATYNGEKWGFVDSEDNTVIEYMYDYVTEFNTYGFAGIKLNGLWGVINEEGEIICECIFDFGSDVVKPEFIGAYYKTYKENGEIYYSDETEGTIILEEDIE